MTEEERRTGTTTRRETDVGRCPRPLARRIRIGLGLGLGVVLGLGGVVGCASRSPHAQDFVEVRTEHFLVTSSLDAEDTGELARSLEFFDAGVRSLLQLDREGEAAPTPVYFFDDRSLGRPFAVQNQAAYLVDAVEAPILVFRGGRDFAARATPELRASYARRILRDAARSERPLWYEEGMAQMASSMLETPEGVEVGRFIPEYRRSVLDWRGDSIQSALGRDDLADASKPERERFAARAWAIVHTLEFGRRPPGGASTRLVAYQQALDSPDPGTRDRAFSAIGLSPEALSKQVYAHLELARARSRLLRARGYVEEKVAPTSLPAAEGRARLARLALRLARWKLAHEYFVRALHDDAGHVSARLGLAETQARMGEPAEAEQTLGALPLPREPDAGLACEAADAHRALAAATDSASRRRSEVARARGLYERALADPALGARAAFGLAQLALEVPGEDVAEAERWIDVARSKRGGSLALDRALAVVESRTGAVRSARIRARHVITRSPDALEREAARALLESLDD
ncbi:MAG: tetratricopeptide repeat protein [Myxococcota bacterium]